LKHACEPLHFGFPAVALGATAGSGSALGNEEEWRVVATVDKSTRLQSSTPSQVDRRVVDRRVVSFFVVSIEVATHVHASPRTSIGESASLKLSRFGILVDIMGYSGLHTLV
jgi:hypothetical protein